jgi:hypothetical protein
MSANCEEELQKEKRIQSIKELEASMSPRRGEGAWPRNKRPLLLSQGSRSMSSWREKSRPKGLFLAAYRLQANQG